MDERSGRQVENDDGAPPRSDLGLRLAVGAFMAALVAGLVWSTGHGLAWW